MQNFTTARSTHFVRDAISEDLIEVIRVPSAENAADGLTKPPTKAKHRKFIMCLDYEKRLTFRIIKNTQAP
ncbi:hypothetical protein BFJ69_g934 [Fusarium oxysporum]|uniref:Uncharacterized protein n=1 Tax=Fusarium oxysporum TaxID=5507 RepID=A0A420P2E7_FUSOX|nr:hypothetical protein BFJ69_g934 [Fusarium oxysporum]